MLIQSKITTLQVVRDCTKEKSHIYLRNSKHSIRDTIPVILDISCSEPIKLNNIGLTFKLYHQLSGILLKQYDTTSFVFPIVEMNCIRAILYINGVDIKTFYQNKTLEFPNKLQSINYSLDITVKTTQNISNYTDSGEFYVY